MNKQKHKNTKTQKHKNTKTQKHKNTNKKENNCGDGYCSPKETHSSCPQDCEYKKKEELDASGQTQRVFIGLFVLILALFAFGTLAIKIQNIRIRAKSDHFEHKMH